MAGFGGRHRIFLRAAKQEDFVLLSKWRNDPVLQEALLAVPRPNSQIRVRRWLERRAADDHGAFFVIAEIDTDRAMGFIQASGIDSLNRVAEIGICIDTPGQGRGLGRQAMELLEQYLRKTFNLRKTWLHVGAGNAPALALYRSCGFRVVGTLRKHRFANGRYQDVVIMEKLLGNNKAIRQ